MIRPTSNQALERKATRFAFTRCVTRAFSLRAMRAPRGPSLILFSLGIKMRTMRQIVIGDIPSLFRVRIATDENRLSIEELAALGIDETSVTKRLVGSCRGWLCEEDGEVVGFAMGDKASGEMWVIAVLPSHVGQGIGGALLESVDQWLSDEGCAELWLTTDVDPTLRAYSFYRRHGWIDWKIEGGMRYMKKILPNRALQPMPLARGG